MVCLNCTLRRPSLFEKELFSSYNYLPRGHKSSLTGACFQARGPLHSALHRSGHLTSPSHQYSLHLRPPVPVRLPHLQIISPTITKPFHLDSRA